jgi:ABC-type transport system involved in multi-copper enzyme maturation permease subunit
MSRDEAEEERAATGRLRPMTAGAPARSPAFAASVLRVFDVSLGLMLWSRRTIFMALVVGAPVAMAILVRVFDVFSGLSIDTAALPGPSAFGLMVWLYVRFPVPVLAVFYGTALIADEVEDKTITYLFTRPLRRGAVLVGKYLAYLVCTILVVLPSVMVVYFLIVPRLGGSIAATFPVLLKDLAILAVALAVYGALFAFVGAWFKRPLVTGLVFLFGWEPVVLVLPGYLKKFTVMHYLQALVPHTMPSDSALGFLQSIFRDVPSFTTSVLVLLSVFVVCLALAARTVERNEYVLDQ